MRYAFIADVHANREALEAVLREVGRLAPDRTFCLGDLVGYGAEPRRCIEIIRQRGIECLVGNHDLAAVGAVDMEYFNDAARQSVEWTQSQLGRDEMEFLAGLPYRIDGEGFTMTHGAFPDPAAFDYILTIADAERSFHAVSCRYAFTAHSHVPLAFVKKGRQVSAMLADSSALPAHDAAIVNVGSVGQPRDSIPAGAFALFDTDDPRVSVRRVSYDMQKAAQKILAAGLPPMNAYRLFLGR